MTKSALKVAQEALAIGRRSLPVYASKFSRKDYTLPQHFALLVLRRFLRTEFRGVVAIASEWAELREVLGLAKIPDHSTLWHVEQKLVSEKGGASRFRLLRKRSRTRADRRRSDRGDRRDRIGDATRVDALPQTMRSDEV